MATDPREWIFTFGFGQWLNGPGLPYGTVPLHGKYVRVWADTADEARQQMYRWFGRNWAFQYKSAEEAGVREFGLKELVLE